MQLVSRAQCVQAQGLTASHIVFVLHASLVSSFSSWIVIHPDFAVITPKHCVGLPELQAKQSVQTVVPTVYPIQH